MKAHEADQHPWNHENVQGEESRKCRARNDRSAEHQLHDHRARNGNSAGNRRPDAEPPISVLIESQHLPAERHPQRHEQKEHTNNPSKLSRKLVGPKQKHLDHVNENNRHHEVRAPSVQRADEPTESHVVVQGLKTAPRLAGRRDVNQRQKNSRHELQDEYSEGGATENIKPTCRVSRHWMFSGLADGCCELQAPIKPFSNLCHPAHGGFFPERAALNPGVGSSPAWMVINPFSTLCGYSKRPRSGGPDAREPSR